LHASLSLIEFSGWEEVPVLALETVGADCFNKSIAAGKLVVLHEITSVAKTLGARSGKVIFLIVNHCIHKHLKAINDNTDAISDEKSLYFFVVAPKLMDVYPSSKIISRVLSDRAAVSACLRFAGECEYVN